jgi:hypothetical protein
MTQTLIGIALMWLGLNFFVFARLGADGSKELSTHLIDNFRNAWRR